MMVFHKTATIKQGVASLVKAKAPNPVTLRPYRTFAEVEQPASQFIFRINQRAEMALFEADGGKWRLDAINNIANFLKEELADQTNITILA
ncbi:phage protein [Streptococcus pseudoporcinus]|uniref:Phage protein n=1 Tax=Streptococcus pseudoporcinus TaxID=361101 RepID=A0A4V6L4T1_9STRE|nr:phage protein [Streptococcus pseudoporcinus]